jgi:[ribosomal protein S5]-alanine N-acetyltransferase
MRCWLIRGQWCCVAASTSRPTPPELAAAGERVHVRTVRAEDLAPYGRAVLASAERIRRWNPVDPADLPHRIATQSADHRTFFVFAREPVGDHPLVGRVNFNGAVRGRFRSVAMGYDAYDPYVGRGLFAEGLRLVVGLALADASAGGMGLHRVEASVQAGNVESAGLLRSLGFRHEGRSPRMLLLADETGREAWRDQERYAVTSEEWPAERYAPQLWRRFVVLLDDAASLEGPEVARALAGELGVPLLPADLPGLLPILAGCPQGAVVAGALDRPDLEPVIADLTTAEPALFLTSCGDLPGVTPQAITRLALHLRAAAARAELKRVAEPRDR